MVGRSQRHLREIQGYDSGGNRNPGQGGGSAVRVFGAVTKTRDGAVGEIYTAPAGMTGVQWYREALTPGLAKTIISGATGSTYVAQAADIGYRMVARGTLSAVLTDAVSISVVFAAAILMDTFDSISGFTVANAANATIILDTTAPVAEGTGGMLEEVISGGTGSANGGVAFKGGLYTVSADVNGDLGTVVGLVKIPPRADRQVQYAVTGVGKVIGAMSYAAVGPIVDFGMVPVAYHASENASIAALGAGSWGVGLHVRSNTPGNARARIDAAYRKAQGRPSVMITLDDLHNDDPAILDMLEARGLVGTLMCPSDRVDGAGLWSTSAVLMARKAKGHQIATDGTPDDASLTAQSSVENAVNRWLACRTALANKGFDPEDLKDSCYPNGDRNDPTSPVQIAAMTGNGTTAVTFGAALGASVADNWTIDGVGVPDNTKIVPGSIAGDRLSATLTNAIPAQTKPAYAINKGTTFYGRALPDALKAAGAGIFRTTGGVSQTYYSRMGLYDLQITTPGAGWTTVTLAQATSAIDQIILRGGSYMPYIHGLTADMPSIFDMIAAKVSAGLLDALTVRQHRERDGWA